MVTTTPVSDIRTARIVRLRPHDIDCRADYRIAIGHVQHRPTLLRCLIIRAVDEYPVDLSIPVRSNVVERCVANQSRGRVRKSCHENHLVKSILVRGY